MKVVIQYEAGYRYEDVVSFSPHRFRLFPRTDHFTRVTRVDFHTNESADVQYRRDLFDNPVASCFYRDPSDLLECRLELEVALTERNAFHFLLAPAAARMISCGGLTYGSLSLGTGNGAPSRWKLSQSNWTP